MNNARTSLVIGLFGASALLAPACGSSKDEKVGSTGTPKLSFESNIEPIIQANCADIVCHGKASPASIVYEGSETNFKASKKAAISTTTRLGLATNDPNYMPRGKKISDSDKQYLLDFLNQ